MEASIYGVSQNSDTNDYIMHVVFIDEFHCQNCDKQFTQVYNKCQLSNLKNITIRASRNEKIDIFIQKMQYSINRNSYMPEVLYGI